MAKKKTPITVTITEGKHATQPWTFSIDDVGPGPKITVRERYTRPHSCKLGAVRKIGGYPQRGYNHHTGIYTTNHYFTQDGREILFIVKRKSTKKK